jgi:deazaflavin-dependent oxidoreductase (nitroreductase family)
LRPDNNVRRRPAAPGVNARGNRFTGLATSRSRATGVERPIEHPSRRPIRIHGTMPRMPLEGEYAPSTAAWARRQAEQYEATNGVEAADLRGRPVIVLTSVGAKTGKLRKTALMRVEHEGTYAVVASIGGAPKHPVWYYNLKANPHVELQDGPAKRDYVAREVTGDEKATWWARAVETWPDYAKYQQKTTRQIPVFVLEPIDS